MQFVDVRNDVAFKKIFGSEGKKEILISFLNAVLDLSGDREIGDLTILNPYQAPKIAVLKETVLDIRAVDKRNVTFIVEIQVQKKKGFEKRVLYYTSKAYVGQLDKGGDYPKLNQVIFIGIVDFNIFEGSGYITRHLILNKDTFKQELTDFEFNFIELPKFQKAEDELESVVDKWIHFIKNADSLKMIPKCADFVEIREAYDIANKGTWSADEYDIYDYWSIRLQDERGAIEYAVEQAVERAVERTREQSLLEGERKGLIEGERKGLIKGIEVILEIKYGDEGTALMDNISNIESIERLEELKDLLKKTVSIEKLRGF
ncbi:MAG: Rpn family recombination-promoting nuclease/putative transposase [Nitrospirae bacterium]|nr:Rpn family recombination-promoting nuclease/putative transposase [Nitrospirota bacterium]